MEPGAIFGAFCFDAVCCSLFFGLSLSRSLFPLNAEAIPPDPVPLLSALVLGHTRPDNIFNDRVKRTANKKKKRGKIFFFPSFFDISHFLGFQPNKTNKTLKKERTGGGGAHKKRGSYGYPGNAIIHLRRGERVADL